MTRVLYFVHDLLDPAVSRRVTMLEAGGAAVMLAGFRRGGVRVYAGAVDLGETRDGDFAQRIIAVARASATIGRRLAAVPKPDVIVARNLEMLAIAKRARVALGCPEVPVVYECLDIHRLLLRDDFIGASLRGIERYLGGDVSLLITSSPAFVRNYFQPHRQLRAPTMLIENKLLGLGQPSPEERKAQRHAIGPPWVVGWFGALRCRKSLALLSAVSRAMDGQLKVVLRGRPSFRELGDLQAFVDNEPFMTFHGPYRNPEDMAGIYETVHFSWAIDFFEEGLNSSWLLPNRLYEGCAFGAVPIAMRDTEVGRYLQAKNLGLLLAEPSVEELSALFATAMPETYAAQTSRLEAIGTSHWVCGIDSCKALVDRIRPVVGQSENTAPAVARESIA